MTSAHAGLGGRESTCSIKNQQQGPEQRLVTRGLHEADVCKAWDDIDNERGQTGAFEAQNYAHIVRCERYADYRDEKCQCAKHLRAAMRDAWCG